MDHNADNPVSLGSHAHIYTYEFTNERDVIDFVNAWSYQHGSDLKSVILLRDLYTSHISFNALKSLKGNYN